MQMTRVGFKHGRDMHGAAWLKPALKMAITISMIIASRVPVELQDHFNTESEEECEGNVKFLRTYLVIAKLDWINVNKWNVESAHQWVKGQFSGMNKITIRRSGPISFDAAIR